MPFPTTPREVANLTATALVIGLILGGLCGYGVGYLAKDCGVELGQIEPAAGLGIFDRLRERVE